MASILEVFSLVTLGREAGACGCKLQMALLPLCHSPRCSLTGCLEEPPCQTISAFSKPTGLAKALLTQHNLIPLIFSHIFFYQFSLFCAMATHPPLPLGPNFPSWFQDLEGGCGKGFRTHCTTEDIGCGSGAGAPSEWGKA